MDPELLHIQKLWLDLQRGFWPLFLVQFSLECLFFKKQRRNLTIFLQIRILKFQKWNIYPKTFVFIVNWVSIKGTHRFQISLVVICDTNMIGAASPILEEKNGQKLELVSKELNHLAAILHVYAGGLNFMKLKKNCYYFSKRKWKYFYTFNHFSSEKSSTRAK